MLALEEPGRVLLIDCGGDVIQRTQAAGLGLGAICGIFITHEHPDHVSGFPLFIEKIWLAGRSLPVEVYGIEPAIEQARRTLGAFDTSRWDLPEIRFHPVEHRESAPVIADSDWVITASPGVHGVPVVGLRFESRRTGATAAYSCDTEPCEAIERLAAGCDLLIHEANGPVRGHSSAEAAAGVAHRAGVRRLVLVHLPAGTRDEDLAAARRSHPGVRYGQELDVLEF
jgi:ribonuclease Z